MSENISPEEKLLRLIRGQPKPQNPFAKDNISAPTENPISFKAAHLTQRHVYPYVVHKIILAFFILSCIYLIVSIMFPYNKLRKIEVAQMKDKASPAMPQEPDIHLKPYDFYLEAVKQRQIFGNVSEQEYGKPASATNTNLIKDFTLLGIITGENPQAVIENKKTQKTYYLNKGQFIDEFQVVDIEEGKIILNYDGQKFELYL